jgi:hypothetical protein
LLQALRLGLTLSNGYLWLLHAWYPPNWWLAEAAERSGYTPEICSLEEIEGMIEYAILVDHFASTEDTKGERTDSHLVREGGRRRERREGEGGGWEKREGREAGGVEWRWD